MMNISETNILVKALAATRSAVTITDNNSPDNPIVYCNTAFLELTGYTKDEVIGNNCRFLQGKDTEEADIENIRQALKSEKDSFNVIKNYTKDGRPFWNELQISPVYDEKGKLSHFIGLQTDVTMKVEQERAKMQAKKLKMQNELLAAEKKHLEKLNEVKDDFISVASHQLRTPATVVKQYLSMLETGIYGELTKKQIDALKIAYEHNDQQLHVIERLLTIAKIDAEKISIKRQKIIVSAFLKSIVKDFKYQLMERQQSVEIDVQVSSAVVYADRHLLRTVFENLIDNAMKYSHSGNTIRITISADTKNVFVDFQDQGIGIGLDDIEKLFGKFTRIENFSTKDIGGTGLGLYWVKKVLDIHGADITVTSTKGKGTTFRLVFPITK